MHIKDIVQLYLVTILDKSIIAQTGIFHKMVADTLWMKKRVTTTIIGNRFTLEGNEIKVTMASNRLKK